MPSSPSVREEDFSSSNKKSPCGHCLDLDLMASSTERARTTYDSLTASAQRGCSSCAILCTVFEPFKSCAGKDTRINCFRGRKPRPHYTIAYYELGNDSSTKGQVYIERAVAKELFTLEGSSCPWPSMPRGTQTFSISGPDRAAQCVSAWIDDCIRTHHSCRAALYVPVLPTRVLEIQSKEQIRLYVPNVDQPVRAHYAALSHCWGGVQPIKTLEAVLDAFRNDIPWNELPRTFQDALDFTRRLGLRYLWVDSLCIVQDDAEDWRRESSKMASIYSSSYITIAATNSSGAHGGLYGEMPPRFRAQSYVFKHDDCDYTLYLREPFNHNSFFNAELPLLQRAWCFQERLLSPRVVHFGDTELYWECSTGARCECGEYLASDLMVKRFMRDGPVGKSPDPHDVHLGTSEARWHDVVSQYSTRAITFEDDLFPAIQGVAKRFQAERKCAYYAGLWEDTFLYDLLWYWYWFPDSYRPKQNRAPSWSWASIYAPKSTDKRAEDNRHRTLFWFIEEDWSGIGHASPQEQACVISVATTPTGDDPTGQVDAGVLKLRGRCLHATEEYVSLPPLSQTGKAMRATIAEYEEQKPNTSLIIRRHDAQASEIMRITGPDRWHYDCSLDTELMHDIVLMEIVKNDIKTACLALQRVHTTDTYQRVGLAVIRHSELKDAFESFGDTRTLTIV